MSVSLALSEEQEALRNLAHDFALNEMRPVAAEHDRTGEYPIKVMEKAHSLGLMNTHIPAAYGGLELGALDGLLIAEELAWGCSGMCSDEEHRHGAPWTSFVVTGRRRGREPA